MGDGDILLNPSVSNTKMYETLQEEIAHYDTTVGDIVTEDTIDSRKQEHRARSLAMTRAVSLDKLIYCHNHGLWELDEIADYCNVDVEYLTDAINNYRVKRGLTFAYKGYRFDLRKNVKIEKI
ncbi:toxin [Limosilactobacillus reuteri]|uniref:toxin n=1 Tax=Limosilactobacillus reuteri TaxID=1598 RepID=UPI00129B39F5|nr:toxin [Limosilactobacillus reuteri]